MERAPQNDLVFRQIKKEEIPLLMDLYKASFPDKAPELPFEEEIVNEKDSYGAFEGTLPVAMVTANPVLFWGAKGHQIFKLCARKDYRGKGVARALVAFMHKEQKKKGDRFSLVMPGGERLYTFYENCGYLPIAAKKQIFLPGDALVLPAHTPIYTDRYKAYCKKSAEENGKVAADEEKLFWGFEKDDGLLADDCLERGGICRHSCHLYLPDEAGNEKYGMVCAFDDEVNVKGVFISLVNGFH